MLVQLLEEGSSTSLRNAAHDKILAIVCTSQIIGHAQFARTIVILLFYFNHNAQFHCAFHYENTPIQIYRKFHHQKMKIFR